MSDIQLYLAEAGKRKDEARKIAQDVARKLERKETPLLEVIESVGQYINNDDTTYRSQSLAFLADVLEFLPLRVLSLQHRTLLTDFVLSRIEDDSEGLGACARALKSLEGLGKWDAETAKRIFATIVSSQHTLKSIKLQGERFAMLQLLDLLLAKYRDAINERVDGDFELIERFVAYLEGEKDPRNLMIVFSIVMVPMSEWNLGPSVQDMFELVFNYFPITFKPPPGDLFKITAQDLKDRLKACVASNAEFAPYAFPALLDKLDSSSMNTKRDVLQALIACILNYEPHTISLYSVTLWDALKFEILSPQEEDLAQSSMDALAAIAKQLTSASEGALHAYLKPIVKECNEHLEDAPTRQSEAAGSILSSIAKASPQVADFLVKGVLPTLLTFFRSSDSIPKRRGLLEVLNMVLQAVQDVSQFWQTRNDDGIITSDRATTQALRDFKTDIIEILLQATISAPKTEVSFRLVSLRGLELMLSIPQLLTEADTERILQAVTDIIIRETSTVTEEINATAIKVMTAAAKHSPRVTADRAIPALVAELPDQPEPGIFTYEPALESLAKLSVEAQVADTIIIRLKNKLNAALRHNAPRTYLLGLLTALLYIFTNGQPAKDNGVLRIDYLTSLVLPILNEILGIGINDTILTSEIDADIVGRICNVILREQTGHTQNQFVAANQVLLDSLRAMQMTPEAESQHVPGSKLGVIASLYLHAAFRADIHQEVPIKLIRTLLDIAREANNTRATHTAALRHMTVVVNKFVPSASLESVVQNLAPDLLDLKDDNSVAAALAIAKGLIVSGKNSKLASRYLQAILALLTSETQGHTAAIGIAHLLTADELLSKPNHANISGLYKQRTYHMCYDFITTGIKSATPTAKRNYLIALSGLLRNLPYDIVRPSLTAILPLLLQTLDLGGAQEGTVKVSTLNTLEAVLLYDAGALNEHASSLISRFLSCTQPLANGEHVRVAALKCLKLIPAQLRRETIIPLRRQTFSSLLAVLDDKRRGVRLEAVKARAAWLALDQDDPEDA